MLQLCFFCEICFFGCDLESNALGGIEIYEKVFFFRFLVARRSIWCDLVARREFDASWSPVVNLVRSGRQASNVMRSGREATVFMR